VAASVIEVESLAYLAAILEENGVPFHRSDRASLWVGPEDANGAVIEFIETVG
jgi:hypothetical protein